MVASPQLKWFGTGAAQRRPVHGRARHRDRERRPSRRSRRISSSRRPTCSGSSPPTRSSSAASCCSAAGPLTCSAAGASSWSAGGVHDRLAALRARVVRGVADRRARPPGPRRGHDLARRARDPDDHLRRRPRTQHRARRLGRRRRLRCRRRRAPRRRPHRRAVVGVDLLRQHPGRRSSRWPWLPCCSARARTRGSRRFDALGAILVTTGLSARSCSRSRRATSGAGAPAARSASSSSRRRCSQASWSGRTASPSR